MVVSLIIPMLLPHFAKFIMTSPFEKFEKHLPGALSGKVNIQLLVGLDGAGPYIPADRGPLNEAGGHLPNIRLWDPVGRHIGNFLQGDRDRIRSGTFAEIHMKSYDQQPAYLELHGKENAICLAMLTMSWPGGQGFLWTGNWAHICNESWYFSNVFLGAEPLKCAWLDENGNVDTKAISMHIPDFFTTSDDKLTPETEDLFCSNTPTQRFIRSWGKGRYRGFLKWTHGSRVKPVKKQKATTFAKSKKPKVKRSQAVHRMVKSSKAEHSARELCESPSSVGPDLVSLWEGTFCDMDTRQVYDLCSNDSVDCFDVETRKIRASEAGIKKRGEPIDKEYSQVLEW